jgi:glycosidase
MNEMLDKLHEADVMVMLDIVPNHMGYIQPADDFSTLVPFNDSK